MAVNDTELDKAQQDVQPSFAGMEAQFFKKFDSGIQSQNEESIKIVLKNYIDMLKSNILINTPLDFSNLELVNKINSHLSIEEIGLLFQHHELYFLTSLQNAYQQGKELNEVIKAFDDYELFLSRARGMSAKFDPEKVVRNDDLIQTVISGYAEFIIDQLRLTLEKLSLEESVFQQEELNQSIQKMLKEYKMILGRTLKIPLGLSPAFFKKEFIENLSPHLSLDAKILFSVYADGTNFGTGDSVKTYISFMDEKSKKLLDEEYELRQKMQRHYVRGGDALRTGVEIVKTLSYSSQFIVALKEYEDFYSRNKLEFTAELNFMIYAFARKKFVGMNSKGSLRSRLAKGSVNNTSAQLLSTKWADLDGRASATEEEVSDLSTAFGALQSSASYVEQKTGNELSEAVQATADFQTQEDIWQEKHLRQLYITFEAYLLTIENEDGKLNLAVQFLSELMNRDNSSELVNRDNSDEVMQKAIQDTILSFLLNNQACDSETKNTITYHFIDQYPDKFKPISDKYIDKIAQDIIELGDKNRIEKLISYLQDSNSIMLKSIANMWLDKLFERAKFQIHGNDEKINKLLDEVKKSIEEGSMSRERIEILMQIFQKEYILNKALKSFEEASADRKDPKITDAMARANDLKYDLGYTLYETLVKTAKNSVDAKQAPEDFRHTKDGKLIHYALDRLDSLTSTINDLKAYKDGSLSSEKVLQRITKEEKEARKDSLGWSIFGAAIKVFLVAAGMVVGAGAGFGIGLLTGGIGAVPGVALGAIVGAKFSLSLIACTAIGATIGLSGGMGLAALAGGAIARHSLKRHKKDEDKSLPKQRSCFAFFSRNKDKEKVEEKESLPMANP